ncbi:MAG: CrcB family protein [Pseudomonadota bacterium]
MSASEQLIALVLVAAGGALGALARYGIVGILSASPGGDAGGVVWPWGVLIVNGLGCLAVGMLIGAFGGLEGLSPLWRAALVTGFLGAFTTFSALAVDMYSLRAPWLAAGYLALSFALVPLAFFLGWGLARLVRQGLGG